MDFEARQIFKAEQNIHSNLGWEKEKRIWASSSENTKIYLWTFAGDKINRAISMLLYVRLKKMPVYDYKKITIELEKEERQSENDLHNLLLSHKFQTEQALEDDVQEKIRVIWFSKFSDCLPDFLAKKTICEKGIDFEGLIRELNKVRIEKI